MSFPSGVPNNRAGLPVLDNAVTPTSDRLLTATLPGGLSVPVDVSRFSAVRVEADVDVFAVVADIPGNQGIEFEDNTTKLIASENQYTDLFDLGTDGVTIEAWAKVNGGTSNRNRAVSVGRKWNNASYSAQFKDEGTPASWAMTFAAKSDSNDIINNNEAAIVIGDLLGEVHHFVWKFNRSGGNKHFSAYVDGQLINTFTASDPYPSEEISPSQGGARTLAFGTTRGAGNAFNGDIYVARIYPQVLLSDYEVQQSNQYGPWALSPNVRSPAAILNVASKDNWADPDVPEVTDASSCHNPIILMDDSSSTAPFTFVDYPGGVAADANKYRVVSNNPEVLLTGGKRYLCLYTRPETSANVRITGMP